MAMPPDKQELLAVADYYQHMDRQGDRSTDGPTVAVNGYVYGSMNHPSNYVRPTPKHPGRPQNIKSIIHTMDKAKQNQIQLRRRKQKYESFVVEPMMGRRLGETPGIGQKEARRLYQYNVRSASDLREMYLDIGKREFIGWLVSIGINEADAKECCQAIHDWCTNYIQLPR